MKPFLSLNTTFAINRIVEPEELIGTIAQDIGLKRIQLIPEHLDPNWPASLVRKYVRRFNRACEEHGVQVTTMLTGTQIRVNQMSHPDEEVRRHWAEWMKRYISIATDLGAEGAGSQFGILTLSDDADPARRKARFENALDLWREVAEHGKKAGLGYLLWEPMSVAREYGENIRACREVHDAINKDIALPFKMNLDVDHGDVLSDHPEDKDPHAWLRAFAKDSPVIHIKQSSANKGGHWPFTPANNENGRIRPEQVVQAIQEGGGVDNELVFELSFRERNPTDREIIEPIRQSVEYWKDHVRI